MFFTVFMLTLFAGYGTLMAVIVFRRRRGRRRAAEEEAEAAETVDSTEDRLIEVINVKKAFDLPVLEGVTFFVRRGETVGVLGKSGTGKSVLLKLIAGFLKPDSGLVLFDGRDTTRFSEDKLLEFRKRVSYVFQGGAFFDFLSVRENIAFPLRERGETDEEFIQGRVDDLLEAVELDGMGALRYDELSVGAKKQVAIARAIASAPEVILYDEPTTGVDPIIGKSLSRLIRKLDTRENLTSIVVTHDLKCLEIVSDRIILLKDGVIRFEGTPADFSQSEDPFVRAFRTGTRYHEEPRATQAEA